MLIGVLKEIKNNEDRVALTPAGAMALINAGHEVLIEKNAGLESGFPNKEYEEVGAKIIDDPAKVWNSEMVIKVKEPAKEEYKFLHEGLIIFAYFHLAPNNELTDVFLEKKITTVAYETVQLPDGSLPLLTPMSEVAGRMATQIGTQYLQKTNKGSGILLAGVPGVERGKVTIIGGGVSGLNAAKVAIGLGARVTILDVKTSRLAELENIFGNGIQTLISNPYTIKKSVAEADLVIGAVLVPGKRAPILVTEEMVKSMRPGSVIVDIAIDQGGIFETTDRVGTHDNPTYIKHGIIHYAITNMPGAVPRTSTYALTNSTLPYALEIANKGILKAASENSAIYKGVNTIDGKLTIKQVADDQEKIYTPLSSLL
ncbi:MAG: alanine dehydrogenase [Miniphocaeibacter sp.]|uniref:alanine dehydrogenase n=1 Tax=Miniphocaeibacter sp. TaxID=3100973 RepID=UPI001843140B|nr:alanine dehydrogenase [Gallicola sp.]